MRRIVVIALFAVMGTVFGLVGVASAQTVCPSESPPCVVTDPGASGATGVSGVSASNLPYTGSSGTSTLAWVGAGLVLAGGIVVVVTYRRRAASL